MSHTLKVIFECRMNNYTCLLKGEDDCSGILIVLYYKLNEPSLAEYFKIGSTLKKNETAIYKMLTLKQFPLFTVARFISVLQ